MTQADSSPSDKSAKGDRPACRHEGYKICSNSDDTLTQNECVKGFTQAEPDNSQGCPIKKTTVKVALSKRQQSRLPYQKDSSQDCPIKKTTVKVALSKRQQSRLTYQKDNSQD